RRKARPARSSRELSARPVRLAALTSEVAGTGLRLSVSPHRHTTARPRWLLHRCKTPSRNGRGRAKLACGLTAVGSAADHFQGPAGEQEVDRLMAQRATSPRSAGSPVLYSSYPPFLLSRK